jgi:hypothetical protein
MGGKYDFEQVKDFAHILMKQVNEKYLKLLLWKEAFKKEILKKSLPGLPSEQNRADSGQRLQLKAEARRLCFHAFGLG